MSTRVLKSHPVPADQVLGLIMQRALDGSRPGERSDGARLALAIEGGGMRGTVSAGMCAGLESLGLIDSFDVIYGSSSGAMNASYTAAGQARLRTELYLHAARRGLINPRRALRRHPPFRLAEIFSTLFKEYPHASDVLERAPAFRVTAARAEDRTLDVLGDFGSLEEMRTAVWASAAVPVLAGDIVKFRGRSYVDGGLLESLPYPSALREGATHVLVLRSRHAGYRKQPSTGVRRWLLGHISAGLPDTVVDLLCRWPGRYNAQAAELQAPRASGLTDHVTQIAPPAEARLPGTIETRPQRLLGATALGAHTVLQAFVTTSATNLRPPTSVMGVAP